MAARERQTMAVDVKWYGDRFLKIVRENTPEALYAAGEIVKDEASSRAPRRSGKLAGSGYVSTAQRTSYVSRRYWRREIKSRDNQEAVVAFSAPHAHLMESGRRTSGVIMPRAKRGKQALKVGDLYRARSRYYSSSARPFVAPGLQASKDSMVERLAAVLRGHLERGMP